MKKIVFVNQVTGPLLIDIVNTFAQKGYGVILYTGSVERTTASLDSRVSLRKLCIYRKRSRMQRLVTWILFSFQALLYLMYDLDKTTKVYLSSNPPFVPFLAILFNNTSYIHIYDVYPDALLALPYITKKSVIYRLFLFLNRKSFKRAKKILTPSLGMKKMLMCATNPEKIKIIPWWADTDLIKPVKKAENKFINRYKLQGKFIVLYSGNFGLTHNIEKILNTALLLRSDSNIKFVIIGDGPKKKIVNDFNERHRLENLLVLPFQDEEMLPHSLAAGDISVVLDSFASGNSKESTASIPSKTYYLMSSGSVIYAESDNTSELNWLINTYDIGMCDREQSIENFVEFIYSCKDDEELHEKFRKNSRLASLNFTKKNANLVYEEIDQY